MSCYYTSTKTMEPGRFLQFLDEVEKRVEELREQATSLETEKETLLASLQQIQDNHCLQSLSKEEQEEIQANAERLICRCLTVEVVVSTPRNEFQEKALQKVDCVIKELEALIATDLNRAKKQAQSYLNACLPEPTGNSIDHKFQGMILECTVDDQKKVRRRLDAWIRAMEDAENGSLMDSSGDSGS